VPTKHVFLSYCRDNREEVRKLRDELVAAGVSVWWDQDIIPGQDWKLEIRKAMRGAYAVVLCLSKETADRITSGIYPEVLDAIGAYREYAPGKIFLIPVRLSEGDVPFIEIDATRTLDRLQYVDLFPESQRVQGCTQLVKSLQTARLANQNGAAKEQTPPVILDAAPVVAECDILVLAANPRDADPLQLEREAAFIRERLYETATGRAYRVHAENAVRVGDLSRHLLNFDPQVVHFSGHGNPLGELIFENEMGAAQPVTAEALASLLAALRGRVECVLLNACFTLERADALADQVKCVIGMAKEIDDESARRFSAGFYRGLAFSKDYHTAFELGRNEIALYRLPGPEIPHFISRDLMIMDPAGALPRVTRTAVPPILGGAMDGNAKRGVVAPDKEGTPLSPLWFGTNRKPNSPGDLSQGFSGQRDNRLHFGTCRVAVPKSHKIGSIGSSWWRRLLTWTDDGLKLDRASLQELAETAFWSNIKQALGERDAGERTALVFLHGYNVSFEGAALRAAQIGFDLQTPGATAFYSWPSKASFIGYTADEASIESSEGYIASFLKAFAQESGAERVHIIAHSMGNRGLLRSLHRIIQQAAAGGHVPFGQIFLAAPDVDADVFRQLAGVFTQVTERTTLYVSSRDRALASSGIVHDYPRAGYNPPVTIVPGIDTVEVSNIDLTFLGHGYYADARNFLQDMHALLLHNEPPEKRMGVRAASTVDAQAYWVIGP
jgi:esterase/lipase superfamily enzyme